MYKVTVKLKPVSNKHKADRLMQHFQSENPAQFLFFTTF